MLFQGEEWAATSPFQYFTSHEDPDLGRAVSEGRRREFQSFGWRPEEVPDPQSEDTFRRSCLDWGEITELKHAKMLDWYHALITLRRSTPELIDGRLDSVVVSHNEDERWLTMTRGRITLAANLSAADRALRLPAQGEIILANDSAAGLERERLRLPAESVAVVRQATV